MKFFAILFLFLLFINPATASDNKIFFNESLLPYKNGLLISNFGDKNTNGYILYYKNGKFDTLISDEILKKPTAMVVYKKHLYVCDRNKILNYNLKNLSETPKIIMLAPDDKELNDAAIKSGILYATVTNTDRIYKIDLKQKNIKPELWINMPSPNGIAIKNKTAYVSSISKDYATLKDENVIYKIRDIKNPTVERLNNMPLFYDGIGISKNGTIYVSDWKTQSIIEIDKSGKEKTIFVKKGMTPADIYIKNDCIIIPDMFNHRVIIYNFKTTKEKIIE